MDNIISILNIMDEENIFMYKHATNERYKPCSEILSYLLYLFALCLNCIFPNFIFSVT